jgi:myo-inositol catabolism protein IolS
VFTDTSRLNNPLFRKDAFLANLKRVDQLKEFAKIKEVQPAQIALAWLLTLTENELHELDHIFDQNNG